MNLDAATSGVRDTAGSYVLAEAGGEAVRAGYKLTEVGVIPGEWHVCPMRDLLIKGRLGGNYPNQDTETSAPLMKMGNLGRGQFDLSKVEYVREGVAVEPEHLLRADDVLFNTRNTLDLVGKVALWRDELPLAYYNSNLMRLEFDSSQLCSNEYANYALNSAASIKSLRALATGTTSVAAIYTRDLMSFLLLVPTATEQRAIAAALSDVDALLAKLDQLTSKKRDLKQAATQQLLTGGIRLPGFSTPWRPAIAGEVGTFRGGNGFPTREQGAMAGTYPYFKVSDMNHAGNEVRMVTSNNWISEEARKRIGATVFPADSIVFAKVGAAVFLERKKILTMPSCIDNNMAAFVVDDQQVVSGFMHYVFLNLKFGALVSTTALPSLGGRALAQIEVGLPPLPEQTAIAKVLSDMDTELAALEARRDKTRELKQGMMQALLTGRIRLT